MTNDDKRTTMAHITLLKLMETEKHPNPNKAFLVIEAVRLTDYLLDELERAKIERQALRGEVYS